MLFMKLDEALSNDLESKSQSQKVAICGKVLTEIIRRQDPLIASLLMKIKTTYETQIKQMK